MKEFIIADNQELTRYALEHLIGEGKDSAVYVASNRAGVVKLLTLHPGAVVILDYTLFDFQDEDQLLIVAERFSLSEWILFSDELTDDFMRRITAESASFSLLGKGSDMAEADTALRLALRGERYVCRAFMEQMLSLPSRHRRNAVELTRTETEILKEIALGKTTKEIAAARCSSFHTVNTHRKNIFRKLEVNTAYEATKYALRAGLVDSAEYYI
jgi:DNA-binding NarL/FixJ family response regulator